MAINWKSKTVVITGGSSGLGLHVARSWLERGASVLLVARDRTRLNRATSHLEASTCNGARVANYAADITSDEQVDRLGNWISGEFDSIDVLVNAAGKSDRGRADETTIQRYTELLELNFLATVRCTQLLLPMLRQTHGSIVNIGSLAAKSASSFLGAYPASKFPVAAFSQQLRLELADDNVHVLLVCPGPIARKDAGQRYDDRTDGLPESVRKPGGGVKVRALSPDDLSQQIILACEKRQPEIVIPAKARLLFAIQQLSPRWGDWLCRKMTS